MRNPICAMLFAFLFWIPIVGHAGDASPSELVTTFHTTLLKTLSDKTGQSDQIRYDALQPILDDAFNYTVMIKTIAGRHWRQADPKTQDMLLKSFRDVSIAIYADQYAGLNEGKFETLGNRDGPRGLQLVDTKLTTPSREVGLTYVMREKDNDWRIIDVLLDDGKISELARKASEYSKTLRDGGADALIAALEDQKRTLLAK